MKKVLSFFLTIGTIFTFAGCKKKQKVKNLLDNGDFKYGEVEIASSGDQLIKTKNGGEWWCYGLNGGFGQMTINKKRQLEVGIVMTSSVMHGVQLAYDGFAITEGSSYKLEFDAFCKTEKSFEVRIQENGGSYENYLLEGRSGYLIDKIGKKKKHYTYEFTSLTTDAAPRFALNLGWFEGEPQHLNMEYDYDKNGKPKLDKNGIPMYKIHEVITFDNFCLTCTHDSGVDVDPLDLASRPKITLNQVGFIPGQTKQAVLRNVEGKVDETYTIINADTGEEVSSGSVKVVAGRNESSKEYVGIADFTNFNTPGRYKIYAYNCGESPVFEIGTGVYNNLTKDVIMMLYRQRCGEVKGASGDKFAHSACHQDDAIIYGTSTKIDVDGGWHDAGDYGKYVVPGAQTVANLLMTFERVGGDSDKYFKYDSYVTQDSSIPDLLEEAMYELDWMLKMQNSEGQVYHKVTTKQFPENNVLPQNDNGQLYVSAPSYAATADFAAVMAYAARILDGAGLLADKVDEYSAAATKAYSALASMSKTSFKNPDDIKTGEYPDSDLNDELAWAAIEMYALTNSDTYLATFKEAFNKGTDLGLGWANVNGFAAFEAIMFTYDRTETEYKTLYKDIAELFMDYANKLVTNAKKDAYNVTIAPKADGYVFDWGSNLTVASNGIILDLAQILLNDEDVIDALGIETIQKVNELQAEYTKYKQTQLNYLLGQNACAYCFVTGYGTLTPKDPHHRPSIANGEAMKGMLVGGPDSNFEENGADSVATRSCAKAAPAHCYIDNNNSWSTNEITIYWNSPLIYLLVSVEADLLA